MPREESLTESDLIMIPAPAHYSLVTPDLAYPATRVYQSNYTSIEKE